MCQEWGHIDVEGEFWGQLSILNKYATLHFTSFGSDDIYSFIVSFSPGKIFYPSLMLLFACFQPLEDQTKFAVIINSFVRHISRRRHTGGNSPEIKNISDKTALEENEENFALLRKQINSFVECQILI